jgi:hypothetical protein
VQVRQATGGGVGYTCNITGVNFTQDTVTPFTGIPSDFIVQETAIVAAGAIAAGAAAVTTFTVKASTSGLFDYLVVNFAGPAIDGATTPDTLRYNIRFSDQEQG